MRITTIGLLAAIVLTLGTSSCAVVKEREEAHAAQQQVFNKHVDIAHIWVTSGEPAAGKAYTKLGDLSYSEAFTPDAIDEAKIKDKLKNMAYEKWPDSIDAVIKESQAIDGDKVTVTAVAIKYDQSVDRDMLHNMNNNLVASPSGN